jgi:hypothetical protein
MAEVEERETVLTYKKIAQNIKTVVSNLEKWEKSGADMRVGNIRLDVPETRYSVVYKVITNPNKKVIAKKIIKC